MKTQSPEQLLRRAEVLQRRPHGDIEKKYQATRKSIDEPLTSPLASKRLHFVKRSKPSHFDMGKLRFK